MPLFEWILLLLFAAVVLTNLAERLGVPYPSLLAIAGACLAFLPFGPRIAIEPELALALFVAPALLDAAFDTSPRDLARNVIPIASLAETPVRDNCSERRQSRSLPPHSRLLQELVGPSERLHGAPNLGGARRAG
jgi:hypothetical protein